MFLPRRAGKRLPKGVVLFLQILQHPHKRAPAQLPYALHLALTQQGLFPGKGFCACRQDNKAHRQAAFLCKICRQGEGCRKILLALGLLFLQKGLQDFFPFPYRHHRAYIHAAPGPQDPNFCIRRVLDQAFQKGLYCLPDMFAFCLGLSLCIKRAGKHIPLGGALSRCLSTGSLPLPFSQGNREKTPLLLHIKRFPLLYGFVGLSFFICLSQWLLRQISSPKAVVHHYQQAARLPKDQSVLGPHLVTQTKFPAVLPLCLYNIPFRFHLCRLGDKGQAPQQKSRCQACPQQAQNFPHTARPPFGRL